MNRIGIEIVNVLQGLLGAPVGPLETTISVGMALIVLLVVMRSLCASSGARRPSNGRQWIALVLMIGLLLITTALTRLYVLPRIAHPALNMAAAIASPTVALLAICVPLGALILRNGYGNTLAAYLFSLFAAMVSLFVVNSLADSMRGGSTEFRSVRVRSHEIERFIGEK